MNRFLFSVVFFVIVTMGFVLGTTFVFATEDFNSSRSNLSNITQINKEIGIASCRERV